MRWASVGGWLSIVSGAGLHVGQALLAFGSCLPALFVLPSSLLLLYLCLDHLPPHAAVSAVAGECHHAMRAWWTFVLFVLCPLAS